VTKHNRYHKRHFYLAGAVLVIDSLFWIAQNQGWLNIASHQLAPNQPGTYAIDHFIDGDTIAVNMNGVVEKVRFIGVDTPETHKPNTPVQ
jgi:endonuclease YncB( thermonuclease family)